MMDRRHAVVERLANIRLRRGHGGQAGLDSLVINTGWTDEARAASLAVRQAKARARKAEHEKMFAEQRRRGGSNFIEGWYPRGKDGAEHDPHYGDSTREAPYGYVDGTMTPRKEPLYDRMGRPIIPRAWEDYHTKEKVGIWPFQTDVSRDLHAWWMTKVEKAEKTWGPFGRKKRFMDGHPGATEKDWERYDREQEAARKKEMGVPVAEKPKKTISR